MALTLGAGGRGRRRKDSPPDFFEQLGEQLQPPDRSGVITPNELKAGRGMPLLAQSKESQGNPLIEQPVHEVGMPEGMQTVMGNLASSIGGRENAAPSVDDIFSNLVSSLPQRMPEMNESRRRLFQLLSQQFQNT